MNNKTISHIFGSFILGVATLMICHTTQAQHPQRICDPTFDDANWTAIKIVDTTPGALATFTVSHLLTGGNPTDYRRTVHKYDNGKIVVAHRYNSFSYDPSSQGAIATFSYSYSLRHFNPPKGQAVAYQLLVYQNDTYYGGPVDQTFNDAWETFSSNPGLTAASFTKIKGNGPATPDFSCTGTKITFGYLTANSNPNAGTQSTRISGLDNWCLLIANAPPPPPLNPDFALTGKIDSGNVTDFSLKAVPVTTNPPDTSFVWRVAEIDANGKEVDETVMDNPKLWWSAPYLVSNDFGSYYTCDTCTAAPSTFPGKFKQGKKYRITRGVWGPCNPWKAISKTVFMCTTCRVPKVEPDTFSMPKPAVAKK